MTIIVIGCQMCEYKAIGMSNMMEHELKNHIIIKCKRCEYWAEDVDIMNSHIKSIQVK